LSINTIQKKVFFIAVLLGFMRAAFFILVRFSWDSDSGEVANNKLLFYVFDETSTILFFSLTSILILFWAEVYYISVDDIATFHYILKPAIILLNIAAYIAVAICSYLVIDDYTTETDYMFSEYSILIAIVYIVAAVMFTMYTWKTIKELSIIPLQVSTRNERTRVLLTISCVFILSLCARSIAALMLSNKSLDTSDVWIVSLIILYYILFDYLPVCVAIIFHRVRIPDGKICTDFDNNVKPWEIIPLNSEEGENKYEGEDIDRLVRRLSIA
jgi:hypothetical protein